LLWSAREASAFNHFPSAIRAERKKSAIGAHRRPATIKAIGRRMGIAEEKDETWYELTLPEISLRGTTGSVPRIEQCVCRRAANRPPQGGPHMSLEADLKVAKHREKRS